MNNEINLEALILENARLKEEIRDIRNNIRRYELGLDPLDYGKTNLSKTVRWQNI